MTSVDTAERTMSKSEFAAHIGVDPSWVTRAVQSGRLTGSALQGDGRFQRIVVDAAIDQLRVTRVGGQAYGNGLAASARLSQPTTPPPPSPTSAPADEGPRHDLVILEARAIQERWKAEQALAAQAASRGRYVDADDHRRVVGVIASTVVTAIETALDEMAASLASRFGVDPREMRVEMKSTFREARARAAQAARTAAVGLPDTHETDLSEAR